MKADLALPVNKPTKADIILIVVILFLSVFSIVYFASANTNNGDGFEVTVDGKLHSLYSFSDLKDGEIIEIHTEYGYNKFLYENKSVRCIETDCKDKIELKAGVVSKANQILVCLPHRLTLKITGNSNIDAVSY